MKIENQSKIQQTLNPESSSKRRNSKTYPNKIFYYRKAAGETTHALPRLTHRLPKYDRLENPFEHENTPQ